MFELHQGDCLEIMPTLEQGSVAMVFADLPFQATKNAWDVQLPWDVLWHRFVRVGDAKCTFALSANMRVAVAAIASKKSWFRHEYVWHKKNRATGFLNANRAPLVAHEFVLVFSAAAARYTPQKKQGTTNYAQKRDSQGNWTSSTYGACQKPHTKDDGLRYPQSVLSINSEYKTVHPTQKPLALLEYIVATYTNPGDIVLDPVMGSGVTGVACANLGRRFVGIEKDAVYFAAAKARVEKAYADAAAKIEAAAC